MRRFVLSFIAAMAVACFAAHAFAQGDWVEVTVDFEQFAQDIGNNNAWGGRTGGTFVTSHFPEGTVAGTEFTQSPGPSLWGMIPTTGTHYTVNGATFSHYYGYDDFFGMEVWAGAGLSTRTATSSGSHTNEMASITGSGHNGSQVYGVMYGGMVFGSSFSFDLNDPLTTPIVSFADEVWLKSIAIAPTSYTATAMANIVPPLNMLIYGFDSEWNQVGGPIRQNLTQNRGALDDWVMVDLTDLLGVMYLAFTWDGNAGHDPAYFAFDNLVYAYWDPTATPGSVVPEPGTLAILGLGLAGLGLVRRRRKAEPQS